MRPAPVTIAILFCSCISYPLQRGFRAMRPHDREFIRDMRACRARIRRRRPRRRRKGCSEFPVRGIHLSLPRRGDSQRRDRQALRAYARHGAVGRGMGGRSSYNTGHHALGSDGRASTGDATRRPVALRAGRPHPRPLLPRLPLPRTGRPARGCSRCRACRRGGRTRVRALAQAGPRRPCTG